MLFGNRRPRHSVARRRDKEAIRPVGEQLEDRMLLTIDLGGTVPTTNPNIANAPFGMAFGLATPPASGTPVINAGAGWSVSDLGSLTSNGYDDFAIGAPTVSATSPPSTLGTGIGGSVYVVFGSQSVNSTTITDWIGTTASGTYQYTPNDRVGDLGQLTTSTAPNQTNPITGTNLSFPFPYIQFYSQTNLLSGAGASVSSVRLPNGNYGLLIGAPLGFDANGSNAGTGRAYLVTGNLYSLVGQSVNLDSTTPPTGVNIVTFVSSVAGSQLGYSVAGGFNIFGDGAGDVILGAPNATVGSTGGTGAVYAISTTALTGTTQTINVGTIGQNGSTNSAVFAGATSGAQAGWSVADAGDVNGVTASTGAVDSLLIGAPGQSGGGAAYLIYGGTSLASLAQTVNGVRFINLANVGASSTTTGAVPGATILGPSGSRTGFSVSSGGYFDGNTSNSDILIGSPYYSTSTLTNAGLATLLYGAPSTSRAYLTGTINLANVPSTISPMFLTGAAANNLAGYSVSPVGYITAGQPSLILVGAPGFNSNNGAAYLLPGRSGGLIGTYSLLSAESSPLSGQQFVLTTPGVSTTSPPFFGASVSSRFQTTSVTA
ncbi:MAG: beta strand repeat-containing protein, partial [Isosphaeraceae bacterium]